jgi:DNA-binding LacI/PurR family transcriptional regulator
MTTIRKVAARAGVSASTVSRVFGRPEIVAEGARQRVLAAADALGYQPNPVARSLALGRTGNLGLVVPDIANPFFGPVIKAVQREAQRQGLALFVADSDEQVKDERAQARAMAQQVDGLILASPREPQDQLRDIQRITPIVTINRRIAGVPAVLTTPDHGLTQAVGHLVALGHTDVVYLAGPQHAYSNGVRRRSLQRACREHHVALRELGPFEPHFESGLRAADQVLAPGTHAVIAYNDQIALGLMSRLAARGCRVGSDVSVIGIDDTWIARLAQPPLTTVHVPAAAAGTAAVRLLIELSTGGDAPDRSVELPTELIVRSSTGPRRRTPLDRRMTGPIGVGAEDRKPARGG